MNAICKSHIIVKSRAIHFKLQGEREWKKGSKLITQWAVVSDA